MRVVLDTNVVIDAVAARQPFCIEAEAILIQVSTEQIKGYVSANSLADVFYVVRRSLAAAAAKNIIRSLLYSLNVIEVGNADCWQAVNSPIADFEDALLVACAEKVNADYIVTRDEELTKQLSPIKIISPAEFLALCGSS
jgi:predicted nucleic acid-binding protein